MRIKKYSCPNGCKLPPRKKVLTEGNNHAYGYSFNDYPYCPVCGSLMPYTQKKIEDFFGVYHIHHRLDNAVRLIYKSEFNSAVREASVVVETVIREKTGLDLHGMDLAAKALLYETDKQTNTITKSPLIAINSLLTESERNEQEGIRFMLMGFFLGVRNLYQHSQIGSGVSYAINAVLNASFFLNLLDGHSITKHGRWIKTSIDYKDVYDHMPKLMDRIKLRRSLKQNKKRYAIGPQMKH